MAMPEREFHLKLKYFPVQAMCKYLPLRKNGCHIKGMTVYTSRQGTCGIVLHWKGSDLAVPSSQQRRGTPTSFYFLEGEEIIAVSLVVYGYNVSPIGPYLMVMHHLFPPTSRSLEGKHMLTTECDLIQLVQNEPAAVCIFRASIAALRFFDEIYVLDTRSPGAEMRHYGLDCRPKWSDEWRP